jgi:hypothetical protein
MSKLVDGAKKVLSETGKQESGAHPQDWKQPDQLEVPGELHSGRPLPKADKKQK